jgi:hypothetical protein
MTQLQKSKTLLFLKKKKQKDFEAPAMVGKRGTAEK